MRTGCRISPGRILHTAESDRHQSPKDTRIPVPPPPSTCALSSLGKKDRLASAHCCPADLATGSWLRRATGSVGSAPASPSDRQPLKPFGRRYLVSLGFYGLDGKERLRPQPGLADGRATVFENITERSRPAEPGKEFDQLINTGCLTKTRSAAITFMVYRPAPRRTLRPWPSKNLT